MKGHLFALLTIFTLAMLGCSTMLESANEQTTRSLYVFGDSWADSIDDEIIQAELADRAFDEFVTVKPFGLGGTTMAQWANNEEAILSDMLDTIATDPTPNPIVFFTLSGNDLLEGGSVADVVQHQRTLLTQLEASRGDLQIIFAAYDILNPYISPEQCSELFTSIFGSAEPATLNAFWVNAYMQSAHVVSNFDRATAVNTYGTLQGTPGNPNLNTWSPVEYMDDCIHLTEDGYHLYLDTVFEEGITPLICQDAAVESPVCATIDNAISYLPYIQNDTP